MDMSPQYPLNISFKIIAFAPQIYVTDASGRSVMYIRMKALKFKEDVQVFSDDTKVDELYRIRADRVIDFSAKYNFSRGQQVLGSMKRKGVRSLFRAEYLISDASDRHIHTINEDSVVVRLMDSVLNSIPLVGMFSGFFFHPSYTAKLANSEQGVMKVQKQSAFFESKFTVEKLDPNIDQATEERILLSFIMMTLLERARS